MSEDNPALTLRDKAGIKTAIYRHYGELLTYVEHNGDKTGGPHAHALVCRDDLKRRKNFVRTLAEKTNGVRQVHNIPIKDSEHLKNCIEYLRSRGEDGAMGCHVSFDGGVATGDSMGTFKGDGIESVQMGEREKIMEWIHTERALPYLKRAYLDEMNGVTPAQRGQRRKKKKLDQDYVLELCKDYKIYNNEDREEKLSADMFEELLNRAGTLAKLNGLFEGGYAYMAQIRGGDFDLMLEQKLLDEASERNKDKTPRLVQLLKDQLYSDEQIKEFYHTFIKIFCKVNGKKNTLWLTGVPNSGKTSLINGMLNALAPDQYGLIQNSKKDTFPLSDCMKRKAIFWDEPNTEGLDVEDQKLLFGGFNVKAAVKYQNYGTIKKTPVFVASNRSAGASYRVGLDAMRTRIVEYTFGMETQVCMDDPISYDDYVDMMAWAEKLTAEADGNKDE